MRKTHKKILGFLSLGLVAAMTVFAATLPVPGAKATTTTTTMTDKVVVTVIGRIIKVDIIDPENGSIFVHPNQELTVEQEHAKHVDISAVYTDSDGTEHPFNIGSYNPTETHDTNTRNIDLSDYGYGTYTITATGTDEDGTPDTDIITFSYIPIKADVDDSNKDDVRVDLDYEVGDVCSADINLYLNNNLVTPPSPIHIEAPTTSVKIPVEDLATGDYTVKTTAYDCPAPGEDPEPLPFPYEDTFHHDKEEDIPVPDTGGMFMGLNISKTDYLLTAIIVFFAFAILALTIVIKGRKNSKRR